MITRVFIFTPDMQGRTDFRLAYETFRGRDPQKCIKEERRFLAEIQRQLEAVSEPLEDLPAAADLDLRMRKLSPEGGEIRLSQKAHEKLASYVEEAPFMAGLSVQVEDFTDRWSAATKDETA